MIRQNISLFILGLAGLVACQSESAKPAAQPAAKAPAPHAHKAPAAQADASARPTPAVQGMDADGTMHLHDADRCPVCAMIPKKRPKHAAGIELEDGRTYYFCGTGCMLKANLHPEVFMGKDSVVKRAIAPNYMTGAPIDAKTAYWVAGSDVVGPMGPALVAVATERERDAFVSRHGGKTKFRMAELDDALWLKIKGKPAIMRPKK